MKLLDTSVLVDIDRGGVEKKVARLDEQGRHVISMVSVTELRLGVELQYEPDSAAYREAADALDRFLSRFEIKPLSRPVALAAAAIIARLKTEGKPLHDFHDVYVGATARTSQLPILTANVDHFSRIDDVQVLDWAEF